MDIATTLDNSSTAKLELQVDSFNKGLNGKRSPQQNLGKDDFLQILITQLKHQDPTKPMEDREFIAQMAQFSSLEQMTNMSNQFSELSSTLKNSQALNLIGREVEVLKGESTISGVVEAVTGHAFPQLMVGGEYYDYEHVIKVMQ